MSDLIKTRKGIFIPDITVEMFRNASLEAVEELLVSGEMQDIILPSAEPERLTYDDFETIRIHAPKTKSRVENDRRRVIDLWNDGKTTKEIAKETGKTSATISYHIKRFRTMYGDDVVDARAIPYELPKEGDDE